jgi:outer membrane protein TolC
MFAFQAPSYGVAIQMTLPVRCSAANQLEMGAAQIDAAKIARDLAQKNVEAEQQKYELRSITAFEVLDAQARLATVEGSLLQAYTGYQKEL